MRAITLKLITGLSYKYFLHAFTRLSTRKGVPQTIFSADGNNFRLCNKIFLEWWKQLQKGAAANLPRKEIKLKSKTSLFPPVGGLFKGSQVTLICLCLAFPSAHGVMAQIGPAIHIYKTAQHVASKMLSNNSTNLNPANDTTTQDDEFWNFHTAVIIGIAISILFTLLICFKLFSKIFKRSTENNTNHSSDWSQIWKTQLLSKTTTSTSLLN